MKYDFVMGSEVTELQAQKLRIIDSKVYHQGLMIGTSLIHKLHRANPNIYVIAIDRITKQPVGYISCITLARGTIYQTLRSDFVEDMIDVSTIVRPEFTRAFDIFFSSIVVDPDIESRSPIALGLIKRFLKYIENIMTAGNFPIEASAHAVSLEGVKMCERMHMKRAGIGVDGSVLFKSEHITKDFFYKHISGEKKDIIRKLIVNRLQNDRVTDQ